MRLPLNKLTPAIWLGAVVLSNLFSLNGLYAQTGAYLKLETNYPEAWVFLGERLLGMASEEGWDIVPGQHQVRLVPSQADSWLLHRPTKRVSAHAGDTLQIALNLPYNYRIETFPFDAEVWLGSDSNQTLKLGRTPLVYRSDEPLTQSFVIRKEGFFDEEIRPGEEVLNQTSVILRPIDSSEIVAAEVDFSPMQKARLGWIDYTAAGIATVSGFLAVRYKFRADDRFEEYEETGNPSLRDDIDRFDRYSAIALGTMQVSVGVLAFRLVLR